jgi:hypothetical protein
VPYNLLGVGHTTMWLRNANEEGIKAEMYKKMKRNKVEVLEFECDMWCIKPVGVELPRVLRLQDPVRGKRHVPGFDDPSS